MPGAPRSCRTNRWYFSREPRARADPPNEWGRAFSSVATRYGNGPGQTTNGIDVRATYSLLVGRGDLAFDLTATRILQLKTGATQLDGVVVSSEDNRLGDLNFASFAQSAPKLRANFSTNYQLDRHNLRFGRPGRAAGYSIW